MLTLRGVRVHPVSARFDVVRMIVHFLGPLLREGDVLVVSGKFLAISEAGLLSCSPSR